MPRIARLIRDNQPTIYHIVSRTALQGLPVKDKDNDYLLGLIKKLSSFYFVDVLITVQRLITPLRPSLKPKATH